MNEVQKGEVLIAGGSERMKLAKFVTYQYDDNTWFHLTRKNEVDLDISIRNVKTGQVETLILKVEQAFALNTLLNLILERGK